MKKIKKLVKKFMIIITCPFRYKKILKSIKVSKSTNYIIIDYWKSNKNNFGDELNLYILSKLTTKEIVYKKDIFNFKRKKVLSFIGSILKSEKNTNKNLVVFGSGYIRNVKKNIYPHKKIFAVRGPRTRDILLKNNITCPDIYGDPGLILPLFYKPQTKEKKYVLGIIPHYVDKSSINLLSLLAKDSENILYINIQDDIETIVDQINSCHQIISSSLHGLIVADAYKIPALWVEFSSKIIGDGFKFNDYYESVGRLNVERILITEKTTIQDILNQFNPYSIDFDLAKYLKQLNKSIDFLNND